MSCRAFMIWLALVGLMVAAAIAGGIEAGAAQVACVAELEAKMGLTYDTAWRLCR